MERRDAGSGGREGGSYIAVFFPPTPSIESS